MNNIFVKKMLSRYDCASGVIANVIERRDMYENDTTDMYHDQKMLIKIIDAQTEQSDNADMYEALWATALWYAWRYLMTRNNDFVIADKKLGHKILYNNIIDYLKQRFCIINTNKILYVFSKGKFYENRGRIEQEAITCLKQGGLADEKKIRAVVDEIIYRLCNTEIEYVYAFNDNGMIPVSNGVVARKPVIHLLPNSPAWGCTYRLPVEFIEDADTKKVEDFLKAIVDEKDVPLLIQSVAQALSHNDNYQNSYLLDGSGANGKSTFLDLVLLTIGNDNTTSISLQELTEDKFKAAELLGKLMNIYADLPKNTIKSAGKFKMLTGGDQITVERKYAHPFSFVNKAVFIFSANELPAVDDESFAFWRRWTLIQFPNKFKVNPAFERELLTPANASGFLKLILKEMLRIELEGLRSNSKWDEIKEMWELMQNSSNAFVKHCIMRDVSSELPKADVMDAFEKYCTLLDRRMDSIEILGKAMMGRMKSDTRRDFNRDTGISTYYYRGVKWTPFGEKVLNNSTLNMVSDDDIKNIKKLVVK